MWQLLAMINQQTLALVTTTATLAASAIFSFFPSSAQSFELGTYQLGNHHDAFLKEDFGDYGLRLDGLFDRNWNTVNVFDFEADGAAMFLSYNGTEIIIHGTAYNQELNNFWDVNFTYENVVVDGDSLVINSTFNSLGNGTGKIESTDTLNSFQLVDFSGNNNYTFKIATGHRGNPGFSGYGWLNHGRTTEQLNTYLAQSDWIFEITDKVSIPEPMSTLVLLGIGTFLVGLKQKS